MILFLWFGLTCSCSCRITDAKIVIIFNYSLISSLNNHSHLFTRGAKTHLCYIVWSLCYISASVTTVKYNVSTTVKKIIGCCFVVYLRVGTVFQTATYFMFVIPRLRPGLLSLRSVLSSRQTDWLTGQKRNINRKMLFCCFVVLLFTWECWYCLPDSRLLHVCNPEKIGRASCRERV